MIDQALDDGRAGGLGTEPAALLELLLEARLGHLAGDSFHGFDQGAFGVGLGWQRALCVERGVDQRHRRGFTQRRQPLHRFGRLVAVGLVDHRLPAASQDLLAARHQLVCLAV
ncbi:hypothetical protein D3C81_1657560 [compost metagenome]